LQQLETESAAQQLRYVTKLKEEAVVSHASMQLEVKRLRDLLHQKADQVIGLENRKMQLELSMEERQKDIEVHKDVQRLEFKTVEEERHQIMMELNERLLKVDRLKQKFAVVAGRMAGLDQEEHSQAHYIIQAAQERENLQREGDQLNEAIKVAEKEIRLLQRTLQSLVIRNDNFRASFQAADSQGASEQQQLEDQHRAMKTQLIKKRAYLREIATDFEERRNVLGELQSQIMSIRTEVEASGREHDNLDKQQAEQRAKHERAIAAANQRLTQLRRAKKVPADQETSEESDIRLQELQHKNKALINFLMHFVDGNVQLENAVNAAMADVGLKFPSRPPSVSSRASSVASLV
jgi:UDP-glucose:O-linked fucose beta-1,3-glucosyltransferase